MKLTEEKLIEFGFKSFRNLWTSKFTKNHVTLYEISDDNFDNVYAFCYDTGDVNKFKQINTVEELKLLYEFLTETKL